MLLTLSCSVSRNSLFLVHNLILLVHENWCNMQDLLYLVTKVCNDLIGLCLLLVHPRCPVEYSGIHLHSLLPNSIPHKENCLMCIIFRCDTCDYCCLQLMKWIVLFTVTTYELNPFLGAVELFKSHLKEVISQQCLLQHLTEFITLETEFFRSGLILYLHCTIPTRGCFIALRPAELQPLATRRKDLFTLPFLLCPASVWKDASPYPELWFCGDSRSNMIPFSSSVGQHTLLHCAYNVLTLSEKLSSRRSIFANGIILWQMEMVCSKQHPTLIGNDPLTCVNSLSL